MNDMKRRDFLRTGLGAALATACMPAARAFGAGKRPNILWIYSDDHAENAISAYGGRLAEVAPTPNIDRIATEGAIFTNSFVTNSICGPCRAVVLTGKHSHVNGFRKNGDKFDGHQQTFPQLLQKEGYETAVIGKWHLSTDPVGFDHWEVLPGQGHYYNPDFITPEGKHQEKGYVTDLVTDKALDWLSNDHDSGKPFMLMLQHKAPHRAWEPGPDHLDTYDDRTIPEPETLFDDYAGMGTAAREQDMSIEKTMKLAYDLKVYPENPERDPETLDKKDRNLLAFRKRLYGRMTDEQRAAWDAVYQPKNDDFRAQNLEGDDLVRWKYQRYMRDYLRCIASVDDNVGRVLNYLDETGLAENTVVFYSSDQSFYLGEHGWFDKRFIYEESLRTPMVARWPGVIEPGTEIDGLVQNLDAAETFLDIAGVDAPKDMQGESLVPLMRGETPEDWRESVYYHYHQGEGSTHNVYKHYGLRTDRYMLVYFYTLDEWELYDMETDPNQVNNQYANLEYKDVVKALKKELYHLREHYGDTASV